MGASIHFIKTHTETNGLGWEAEYRIEPAREKAKEIHLHLHSDEWFQVKAGQCKYMLNGKVHKAVAGDEIYLPAGKPHIHPWNTGKNVLVMRNILLVTDEDLRNTEEVKKIEDYIEHWFFLASRGQVRKDGKPYLLQSAVFFKAIQKHIINSKLPPLLHNLFITPLAIIGRLKGYTRAVYE